MPCPDRMLSRSCNFMRMKLVKCIGDNILEDMTSKTWTIEIIWAHICRCVDKSCFQHVSSFTAICSLMAAVTILTSLVYASQRLMITSKWHKWVCVCVFVCLSKNMRHLDKHSVMGFSEPHKARTHYLNCWKSLLRPECLINLKKCVVNVIFPQLFCQKVGILWTWPDFFAIPSMKMYQTLHTGPLLCQIPSADFVC